MTPIEQALFLDGSAHHISAMTLSPGAIVLSLHPWDRPDVSVRAVFQQANVVSVDDSYHDDRREFPWDIIGFDSEPLAGSRWRFCLHTDCIEYVFDSDWPEISKMA